eukprot:3277448-Prymnesium_polylepis.1
MDLVMRRPEPFGRSCVVRSKVADAPSREAASPPSAPESKGCGARLTVEYLVYLLLLASDTLSRRTRTFRSPRWWNPASERSSGRAERPEPDQCSRTCGARNGMVKEKPGASAGVTTSICLLYTSPSPRDAHES